MYKIIWSKPQTECLLEPVMTACCFHQNSTECEFVICNDKVKMARNKKNDPLPYLKLIAKTWKEASIEEVFVFAPASFVFGLTVPPPL